MGGAGDSGAGEVYGVPVLAVESCGPPQGGRGEGAGWDALVLVVMADVAPPPELAAAVKQALQFDAALDRECGVVRCDAAWGGRLVLAPTGPLTPYHDVRSVCEAAAAGLRRAAGAGAARAVLALQPHPRWPRAPLAALLAALATLHAPLQVRETAARCGAAGAGPGAAGPAGAGAGGAAALRALGVWGAGGALRGALPAIIADAVALETARGLARDIGGADPERMSPLGVARHVAAALGGDGGAVRVRVLDDADEIRRQYPLFAAVSRAADTVDRHRGCVVFLEYTPAKYDRTVMLVGKGVTYDTGGADIKAGGAMAGMSRDKCGAAAVAGFFKALALLGAEAGVRALGALALVRNSVGEESYVADELLLSRRARRVRVGNTDAEGRMVMADLLAEMRERAEAEAEAEGGHRRVQLYSVATLTGHAARTVGAGYSVALDSHAAVGHAAALRDSGAALADMIEISTIRREDLATHRGRGAGDHLHQADNLPSTQLPRGHQGPAAFLLLAAGLEQGSVPYTHLDIAASAGSLPHQPTAAPLLALAAHYGLLRSAPTPTPAH